MMPVSFLGRLAPDLVHFILCFLPSRDIHAVAQTARPLRGTLLDMDVLQSPTRFVRPCSPDTTSILPLMLKTTTRSSRTASVCFVPWFHRYTRFSCSTNQKMVVHFLSHAGEHDAALHACRILGLKRPVAGGAVRVYCNTHWDMQLFVLLRATMARTRAQELVLNALPVLMHKGRELPGSSRLFLLNIVYAMRHTTRLSLRGPTGMAMMITPAWETKELAAMVDETDDLLRTAPTSDFDMVSQPVFGTSTVSIGSCLRCAPVPLQRLSLTNYVFQEKKPMGNDVRGLVLYMTQSPTLERLVFDTIRFQSGRDIVAMARGVAASNSLTDVVWRNVYSQSATAVNVPWILHTMTGKRRRVVLDHMGVLVAMPTEPMVPTTVNSTVVSWRSMTITPSVVASLAGLRLVTLDTRCCQIDMATCPAFLEWIGQGNCPLQRLVLQNNSILGTGLFFLAQALGHNHSIRFLDLSDNFITRKSFRVLTDSLPHTLETLMMKRNMIRISAYDLSDILKALEQTRPRFKLLNLSGNCVMTASALDSSPIRVVLDVASSQA
jgi:hypothetical protein